MSVEPVGPLVPTLSIVILVLLIVIIWLFRQWKEAQGNGEDDGDKPVEKLVNRHYAGNQVILGGRSNDIDQIVDAVNKDKKLPISLGEIVYETAVQEEQSSKEDVKETPPAHDVRRFAFRQAREAPNDFQFRHYRILSNPRGLTMPEIERELNKLRAKIGVKVCASANYAVGRAVNMLEGDPGSSEGFPGSSEGFLAGGADGHAVRKNFYNQWALHDPSPTNGMGIKLFKERLPDNVEVAEDDLDEHFRARRTVQATGAGTRIVIFDSSPYDEPIEKHHDIASPFIERLVHNELRGTPDARDHGLFVASLSNIVAPDSTIHLYRVLNDSNRGQLLTLLDNICQAINEYKAETGRNDLCGLVLHLSMGIHVEESLRREVDTADTPDERKDREKDLAPALYCLLEKAHQEGAIIVAAAGNDSAQQPTPKPAQVPALYSFVIGVESSNFNGQRSCFSNKGNVRAPGGDNLAGCTIVPYERLSFDERKTTSVIGFVKEISPGTKHAFWRGTSFAAPFVSGLAALLLEIQMAKEICDPRLVEQAITGTSSMESVLPDGRPPLINVFEAVKHLGR